MRLIGHAICLFLIMSLELPAFALAEAPHSSPKVLISEIKLGGVSAPNNSPPKEYVSIFNVTDTDIDVAGWRLEYAKSNFPSSACQSTSWTSNAVNGSANTVLLSGVIPAESFMVFERAMNDNVSGSLRIMDSMDTIHDLVGWGSNAPCFESQPTAIPKNDKSLQRYTECDQARPTDTDNNGEDFVVDQVPSPDSLHELHKSICGDAPPVVTPPPPTSNCAGIKISEVLPNPSGSDTGREYVELHNPTSSLQNLMNCKLQTSASTKVFVFPDTPMASGEYRVFSDDVTGLTLANSSGGTVWLLDHADTEIDEVKYSEDLGDDVSWSYVNSTWQETYTPTPNGTNVSQPTQPCPQGQYRNMDTNRCNNVDEAEGLEPCPVGKERNPLTNRCRSTASTLSALKVCAPDQYRNPETNRCKKLASVSGLKACSPGQYRNPETNRCKKLGSDSGLKSCKEGQRRNPETNRCKAIAGIGSSSGIGKITDIPAPLIKNTAGVWLAAATITGAIAYGLFEWRNEIASGVVSLKAKFATTSN